MTVKELIQPEAKTAELQVSGMVQRICVQAETVLTQQLQIKVTVDSNDSVTDSSMLSAFACV